MGEAVDFALAILNGAIGDHLARTKNELALRMQFVDPGPSPSKRVVILVHGLMCTETSWRWVNGSDYGRQLEREFGFTPYYLRYNSGRAISDSGNELSALLSTLVSEHPQIKEIILLGFSMGGLVIRAACHAGRDSQWLPLVRQAIYVGTPHRGAPLERFGRLVTKVLEAVPDPYTKLIASIANVRSLGVKALGEREHPVPLLPSIEHFLIAGTLSDGPLLALLFGDSMVSIASATNGSVGPHFKIISGIAHIDLSRRPEIYTLIEEWLRR